MIVALLTTFREGRLVQQAVTTAMAAADLTLVADGPVSEGGAERGDESDFAPFYKGKGSSRQTVERLMITHGGWESDAAKRSELVDGARGIHRGRLERGLLPSGDPLWCLWVDGDEIVLWPEQLRDWLDRALLEGDEQNATGGLPLRLVELDGSVSMSVGRVIRGDHVARYLVSGYQVELGNGAVVALPNLPLCSAGGVPLMPSELSLRQLERGGPLTPQEQDQWLATCRPPHQGEPHLLHRSGLRPPGRDVERMHDAEAAWFERQPDVRRLEGR